MPNLTVPLTAFQATVLQRLQTRTGVVVADFAVDRLFSAINQRLALDLSQVIALEQAFITAGNGTACGHTLTTGGTQPFTLTCLRLAEHLTAGVSSRQSHAGLDAQGALTSWLEGQAG